MVEVVDSARLEVGSDDQRFALALSKRVGKMLFLSFQFMRLGVGTMQIDVVLSAPGGPTDALVRAVRSVLPSSGMTITEHRMDAIDLAHGA